jgi:hypothetical protein
MIKRYEFPNTACWIELENGMERTNCSFPRWDMATVTEKDLTDRGWKLATNLPPGAFSGHDPNDIQYSKPCCGGGINSPSATWGKDRQWHDADCSSLKPQETLDDDMFEFDFWGAGKQKAKSNCECGGYKTANPNCHAPYCPEYKK